MPVLTIPPSSLSFILHQRFGRRWRMRLVEIFRCIIIMTNGRNDRLGIQLNPESNSTSSSAMRRSNSATRIQAKKPKSTIQNILFRELWSRPGDNHQQSTDTIAGKGHAQTTAFLSLLCAARNNSEEEDLFSPQYNAIYEQNFLQKRYEVDEVYLEAHFTKLFKMPHEILKEDSSQDNINSTTDLLLEPEETAADETDYNSKLSFLKQAALRELKSSPDHRRSFVLLAPTHFRSAATTTKSSKLLFQLEYSLAAHNSDRVLVRLRHFWKASSTVTTTFEDNRIWFLLRLFMQLLGTSQYPSRFLLSILSSFISPSATAAKSFKYQIGSR